MKIGILIDRLNVGGVEKIAIEEATALRKIGVETELVVLRKKSVVANVFPDLLKDVKITYLDQRLPRLLRFSFGFPVFSFFSLFHITYPLYLPFVVKKHEYDYLIVHGTYTSFSAITISKFKKIKFSAFIWDPITYILERAYSTKFPAPVLWILKKAAYIVDRFLINRMDNVLVGGAAHNAFIHKINPNKAIKVIYPSVHPLGRLQKKEDYVLMVTAWKEGKNPEYVCEIVKRLPNLHIKMVGKWVDPEYRKRFEALIQKRGISKQLEVIGGVSETELVNYYSHALVLLQTNDDRGFGMPAMEAAGSGTTFIIPRGQGVCELFVNGKDGFYTKERDTKTIVELLQKVTQDKGLAGELGEHAWITVKNNYSWQKHAEEIKLFVDEVLEV